MTLYIYKSSSFTGVPVTDLALDVEGEARAAGEGEHLPLYTQVVLSTLFLRGASQKIVGNSYHLQTFLKARSLGVLGFL